MSLLRILEFPDPRLRKVARPVAAVDDRIRTLVEDMLETMYAAPGIGLAATQVDVHQRVIVLDVSEHNDQPQVFINPEILEGEGVVVTQEGCLSVPEVFAEIERSARVRVKALDADGAPMELEVDGLLAVCIQHEMDHLQGKLFVDYLSDLKRERIRRKLGKDRHLDAQERSAATVI